MANEKPRFIVVTPMKDEGPFVLEWVAHNKAIGADDIVVFSNDCTDGSDALLRRLHDIGAITHVDNTSERSGSPQKRAYKRFLKMRIAGDDDWVIPIDADEHINVKTGDHTLQALVDAVPDAQMISMTWRLFGNSGVETYQDRFLSDQFHHAAPEWMPRPPQAWGFKTMFKRGLWDFIGVHRPKRPRIASMDAAHWYNGSGQPMPERYFTGQWRSMRDSVGYDLVQINHYALKSCESYLVKKLRGRAHHTGEALGLDYWNMMNQNASKDRSVDAVADRKKAQYDQLAADPALADLHRQCCDLHKARIAQLRQEPDTAVLLEALRAPGPDNSEQGTL